MTAPLNATRFLSIPCELLNAKQRASFGIGEPGRPDITSATARTVGPACDWLAKVGADSTTSVTLITGNKHGIADIYAKRSVYAYFEEAVVDGYPAVFSSATDTRDDGTCGLAVGISDPLVFSILEQGNFGRDSCTRAKNVATAVIETLKAGA